MAKRIYKSDIERFDALNGTSHIRLLEMIVDSLVAHQPGYAVQYFRDLGLYGLDEAKTYLIRFVDSSHRNPPELQRFIDQLNSAMADIILAIGKR